SHRGRRTPRGVLLRGDAPRRRNQRHAPETAAECRCRPRARLGRGDDEAARHRVPPEPARGLADRAARSSSPDAEGLRGRALYRDRLAGRRSDAGRVAGGVRMSAYSEAVREMVAYLEPVIAHVSDLALERLATRPGACDFRFGNPQEMPLPAIERALT